VITQCCIAELYKLGEAEPIALAKKCERRRCGHIPDPLTSRDCLTACVNIHGENKHRYILATQDEQLRSQMRLVPGVPMVYIRRAVMIMEPPSPATMDRREELERNKLGGGQTMGKRNREEVENEKPKKKKKAVKEPNPLSVKKKKPKANVNATSGQAVTANEGSDPEMNIIGEVTDSLRRHKSTRRRRKHKKLSTSAANETISMESEQE
jgi:U3 small nucleolar RNA-associated protein 23